MWYSNIKYDLFNVKTDHDHETLINKALNISRQFVNY